MLVEVDAHHGTSEAKEAYKSGVYAPCIKLQIALGEDALARGKERRAELKAKSDAYFTQPRTPETQP